MLLNRIGNTEVALLGSFLAVFLNHDGTEDLFALPAAERTVGLNAGHHRFHHLGDEESFEILRDGIDLLHAHLLHGLVAGLRHGRLL